jgi:hypothetical protein
VAKPVAEVVLQIKRTPGLVLGGANRKAHCKNRALPELLGMAALDMPFPEAIRRATAVQHRLGLTLSQLRETCRIISASAVAAAAGSGAQLSSTQVVPGTEKRPVLVVQVRASLAAERLL